MENVDFRIKYFILFDTHHVISIDMISIENSLEFQKIL